MNRRRAISLIELLLTMSACSVILTMSATLIHRAMHAQSKARAIFDGERAALRLSEHFRRDVHAATAAETDGMSLGAGVVLRLTLPDRQTIEYRRAEGTVQRILIAGNATQAREEFKFPAGTLAVVHKVSPSLLTLSITTPLEQPPARVGQPPAEVLAGPLSLQATARLNRASGQPVTTQEAAP